MKNRSEAELDEVKINKLGCKISDTHIVFTRDSSQVIDKKQLHRKRLARKIYLNIPDANMVCRGDLLTKLPQLQSIIINSDICVGINQKSSEKYFLN